MSTARSPLRLLQAQADKVAHVLKMAESGEPSAVALPEKLLAARGKPSVTLGLAMDDKLLQITIAWDLVRDTSEAGLSAYVLKYMLGERGKGH